jgi:hypothetical protein
VTTQPAPDGPAQTSELVAVADALRALMADERRALARLDVDVLDATTERKQALLEQLAALRAAGQRPTADEARALTAARLELATSAALVGAALTAVGALLGYEPDDRYDRLARCHARTRPLRVVAY